ncbi:DUF1080 domain-containing protein [Stieleria sp. JC731]|uniref:PVC-type heme-binding CxxCH protein n=1 Tax=Pirellulaceae TaxID=2691357 RepID=UPI001E444077|nr:PVC-type heme-binding CxxCH protein [Stieleria sp. JC731]MCC9603588.1 DUF1080 domain-containing protein [Stieleria sp. JC731]
MNRFLSLAFALLFVLGWNAFCEAQTHSLFDGETFDGWDCDQSYWRIQNGAFVGEIAPGTRLNKNTWLVWKGGELGDFELNFRFRLTGGAGANSGVQIRCQVDNVDHVSGYQADLDMGDTWLGRIYDEHGRALLVERGTRVKIDADGNRQSEVFAPKEQYKVLFREDRWNEYRIVAIGPRIDVYVNGTLFSQLSDVQKNEHDLTGKLAFQLHSGGETKIEFKDIRLENLSSANQDRLTNFSFKPAAKVDSTDKNTGTFPKASKGDSASFGFETGSLQDWTADGNAFKGQPVSRDSIASRWAGQQSNKVGEFFVGGFELSGDAPIGTLTSPSFKLDQRYASFLIGGGNSDATRVEIVSIGDDGATQAIFKASGDNREQMRRVVADLNDYQGQTLAVKVIDESSGGWGHINFDDFRLHQTPPAEVERSTAWRSTFNPLLHHLIPNQPTVRSVSKDLPQVNRTVEQMAVPEGFSVDVVAAEPDVHQPIAFTFDTKGRLWVVEGHSYPEKRAEGEGLDKIVILEDSNGDGVFETRKVFSEGLNLVSGIEVGFGGVWIGAAPQLLFIPDANRDDTPDSEPIVMLDGFGYGDTHETLNSFLWGPDGWLYGNQGVFNTSMIGKPGSEDKDRVHLAAGVWRYHPTKHQFEVFAHGGSNQWGLDYDIHGQLFMTHCRSHWGQGSTTHVMRNGNYWNQVNGGYAPFVSATELPGMPHMKNYLLASSRYGHGEGGAGKRGSREVYGGHSHVGTMIYLGDNWPDSYRNHLFTLNLHGHQINHQVNQRVAGGYETVHAGNDVLFCGDQQFVGVDLKVGPDGAVYISDWYDPRHCHNPNVELWDRGNGRLYRMQFDSGFNPVSIDYQNADEKALVKALSHKNHWHARAARLVLAERSATSGLRASTLVHLRMLLENDDESIRLQSLWTLAACDETTLTVLTSALSDESEYVRAWAVQLLSDYPEPKNASKAILNHCANEESLHVCRSIASAIPDLQPSDRWQIVEQLLSRDDLSTDRDLPILLWQVFAPLMQRDLTRGLALAIESPNTVFADYAFWYAARQSEVGRDAIVKQITSADRPRQKQLVTLFAHALTGMRKITPPTGWADISDQLYDSNDPAMRTSAEQIGASFSDPSLFKRLRAVVVDKTANESARRRAIRLLEADPGKDNVASLLSLLDEDAFASTALPQLARYDHADIPQRVLERFVKWDAGTRNSALELLSSRPRWAEKLLDEIKAGRIDKSQLTAYFANQMANLGDTTLNQRLASEWGRIGGSSAELRDEIRKTINAYNAAPKWAFSERQGAIHFKKLCAACHQPELEQARLAPKLEGTRTKGVEYAIENVIDPNAVIGNDFQARVILTTDGQVVTGLIQSETETAIVVKTATKTVTINQDDVEEIKISENSFMPSGLLNTLDDRERIELFKYILSL